MDVTGLQGSTSSPGIAGLGSTQAAGGGSPASLFAELMQMMQQLLKSTTGQGGSPSSQPQGAGGAGSAPGGAGNPAGAPSQDAAGSGSGVSQQSGGAGGFSPGSAASALQDIAQSAQPLQPANQQGSAQVSQDTKGMPSTPTLSQDKANYNSVSGKVSDDQQNVVNDLKSGASPQATSADVQALKTDGTNQSDSAKQWMSDLSQTGSPEGQKAAKDVGSLEDTRLQMNSSVFKGVEQLQPAGAGGQ